MPEVRRTSQRRVLFQVRVQPADGHSPVDRRQTAVWYQMSARPESGLYIVTTSEDWKAVRSFLLFVLGLLVLGQGLILLVYLLPPGWP